MSARDTEPPKPQMLVDDETEAGFLSRWSRRKQAIARGETPPEPPAPVVAVAPSADAPPEAPLPDPLTLGMADDFSAFLRDKVPPALKHKAMQHLFSHPHFNELDMMDVYMEDFNLVPNLDTASMDLVKHAKAVLSPDIPAPDAVGQAESAQALPAAEPEQTADAGDTGPDDGGDEPGAPERADPSA